jgi:hypothetical protein
MSSSEIEQLAAALAKSRGIPLEAAWLPAVAMHLQRLIDADKIVREAKSASVDIAPRFEP